MNSKLVKSNKFSALLGAFLLLASIPSTAFASLAYFFDIVTNYPGGSSYLVQQNNIRLNARWGLYDNFPTFTNGESQVLVEGVTYPVNFLTMNNYYVPSSTNVFLNTTISLTNWYIPYSNTLSLTIGGTNGMTSNVVWSFAAPLGELTNSTAYKPSYTNSCLLIPIPTNDYQLSFPTVPGWITPSGVVASNWSGPLTNNITGAYARVFGTITVTNISPTNGSWTFTTYPSDYYTTNFTTSALSGTNYATLTNVAGGFYTIHFNPIPGYGAPADQTQTNTVGSSNLVFMGAYTLGSSTLTVRFMPIEAQSAIWRVYDNTTLISHGPLIHNQSTNLTSSNDYTVSYSAVKGYKLPVSTNLNDFVGDRILTNTYIPYSNNLAITIAGLTTATNVIWTLAGPSEFTNSVNYGATFTNTYTNTYTIASVPTGNYAVTFPATLSGYTLSSANPSTNIVNSSPAVNNLTGGYTRLTGTIQVNVYPSNGAWAFTTYPSDFTNYSGSALSGTNDATLTNTPVGLYTIQFLPIAGYELPSPSTVTKSNSSYMATTFDGIYGSGWLLKLHVMTSADTNLAGLGTGSVTITPTNEAVYVGNETWQFSKATSPEISITAIPSNASFFFKWEGDINNANAYVNPLGVTMNQNRNINLFFSRAWNTNDNVSDIDGDGLPDVWEVANGLDPMSDKGINGAAGNFDDDFIPSSSISAPWFVLVVTNLISYSGQVGDAGYPLLRNRLLTRGTAPLDGTGGEFPVGVLGYGSGVPFNNFLECRGLDGYYRTNAPAGMFVYTTAYGDDPMTDPRDPDTDGDEMTDGWEYYFWYWRSANAYAAGITNGANLDWVEISPSIVRYNSSHDSDSDTDGDAGVSIGNDVYEFENGTDPTHADTDGDGMDDFWEITMIMPSAVSNALDSANWAFNPDADFYALSATNVLRVGLAIRGTAFGTGSGSNMCYAGLSNAPTAVWWNTYTNTGTNVFDLYKDTIIIANASLTNHQTGAAYAAPVLYGTNAGLGAFQQGYAVWVDMNGNTNYDAGDVAIVNPTFKHDAVYCMAPSVPNPGVCSFDPRTAWTNAFPDFFGVIHNAPDTSPYNNYQEYLGGDYFGRAVWDAGGRVTALNDVELALNRNSYTLPSNQDTDGDLMPDGWELYVGLNPNSPSDTTGDPDSDSLNNLGEWANSTHLLGTCIATWTNKLWPSDPGVLRAPSPNDPHPWDTDWDGLADGWDQTTFSAGGVTVNVGEWPSRSNPTDADTDRWGPFAEGLPDGWEVYAGTDPLTRDQNLDTDFDGLLNWQEYWTGTVPEWMDCDPAWNPPLGLKFIARRYMDWNPPWIAAPTNDRYTTFGDPINVDTRWFMPPDFMTCPSFLYANGAIANLATLRTTFPADHSLSCRNYHTTVAGSANSLQVNSGAIVLSAAATDSDGDGMDDFWEVFHCLNPCRGYRDLVYGSWTMDLWASSLITGSDDADPTQAGHQVGLQGAPFANVLALANYYATLRALRNEALEAPMVIAIVGPHNFGLVGMDPDNDGLVNFDEYTYYRQSHLHTSPSPLWRTDPYAGAGVWSFVARNFTRDNTLAVSGWNTAGFASFAGITYSLARGSRPFRWAAMTEGFDTDNDMIGDYDEVTGYRDGTNSVAGTDPLNDESPLRNRVLWLDGTNSWARSYAWSHYGDFTKFSVEAWVRPSRLISAQDQVVVEKTSLYTVQLPDGTFAQSALANFQLGIGANGMPYVLFHDVSGHTTNRAVSARVGILKVGTWAHLAGVFDGSRLTLYVNGEANATHRTTDVPARGIEGDYNTWHPNCNLSVGARELSPGWMFPVAGEKFFAGCIDEVRVWDRVLSSGEIIARKNRRLTSAEIGTVLGGNSPYTEGSTNLFAYYRFTDLPDPTVEGKTPSGFPATNRPALSTNFSLVYTNYLVIAADRVKRIPRLAPLDTRVVDSIPVATNGTPDAYGISTVNYLGIILTNDFRNSANPYNFTHGTFNIDMGRGMWLCGWAQGLRTNTWLGTLDPTNPDSTDTDGDGLPDWWEQQYGLDPNSAAGDNGTWGDPDHDGLNNRAEYMAGTDPLNSDTDGTGIGDYDSPRGVYSRTYGEMYTDGDGMPDDWESQNGLDPQKYDANLDLDNDGWSNYAEYQAGTSPNNQYDYPQPLVFGTANYYGNRTGMLRFYAYETNAMDGVPQITKVGTDSLVAEVVGQANGTMIFTGRLPIAPLDVDTVVRISATLTNNVFVTFTFTGPETYTYSGAGTDYGANLSYVSGRFTLQWASAEVPAAGANVSVSYSFVNRNAAAFSLSGFKEGDFYLMTLLDGGNSTFESGEPMGIMDDQPVYLSYSSLGGMRVLLTDTRPGFGRFNWTASATAVTNYPVVINKISESGAPTILRRAMTYPRNYFHEWDFQLAGIEGLMAGTYQWWVGSQKGTFQINWPASLAAPALVYPRGDTLYYARNQFAWTMDLNCPMAHMQIARQASDGSLAIVVDKYIRTPWIDAQGICRGWMSDYAGDWGNGVYYWRVAGWTPKGESAWSDAQTFDVNLSATNSRSVSGDIYYFGKAPATKIIVEAYDNRGFGGPPLARMTLTPPASTGWEKCSYTLRGLEQGAYYVRAFLDVTPAGSTVSSGKLDAWESFGFYRDPNNFYQAGLADLTAAQFMDGIKIIIRDRDTDNDLLPDAWEMVYFGNLDQTGEMDFDGDGETNLEEYMHDGLNLIPSAWDSDGDGLSDAFELSYNSAAFGFARGVKAVDTVLRPTTWDTDGDGYSDGAELLRYRTDPLDPTRYPRYRPFCTDAWSSPGDYDGDGRSDVGIYDPNAGSWSFATMAGQSRDMLFGVTHAQPMVGDYTGDNCSEFAFYDNGIWSLYTLGGQSANIQFGDASMLPVPADYTGDGRTDLALFDTDNGMWYIYDVWSGALMSGRFGNSRMIPVPGDYNGDGAADLVVYEPATGNWILGCLHKYYRTWTVYSGKLGGPTWTPVPGDYDGDGRNDLCLFEGNTGRWMLFTLAGQYAQGTFGWKGCVPVPGDYDGDGRTDLGLYDTNTGMWYINCMGGAYYEGYFGWPGALPITKGRF